MILGTYMHLVVYQNEVKIELFMFNMLLSINYIHTCIRTMQSLAYQNEVWLCG